MERKTSAVLPIGLVAILMAFSIVVWQPAGTTSVSDGVSFHNPITIELKHPSCADAPDNPKCDQPSEVQTVHNLVTDLGLNNIRDQISDLNGAPTAAWDYIQLSTNTTTSSTDITCEDNVTGNGLDIAQGTAVAAGTGNYTLTKTFSVSGTQNSITKVCLHNSSAVGAFLMAEAVITSTSVISGDTLIINYSVAAE